MSRRELIVHSIVWQLMFQRSTLSWGQSPSKRKINLNVFLSTNRDLSCVPLTRRGQTWSRVLRLRPHRCLCWCSSKQSARRATVQQPWEWSWELCPSRGKGKLAWLKASQLEALQQAESTDCKKNKHQLYQKGEDLNLAEGRRSVLQDMRCLNGIPHLAISRTTRGFPGDASGKESTCQCRKL